MTGVEIRKKGKKVSLSYEQHKGIPTKCFGESEYFAVDARPLD